MQQDFTHVNSSRELKNLQKYDGNQFKKEKSPKAYTSAIKKSPEIQFNTNRNLRERKEMK